MKSPYQGPETPPSGLPLVAGLNRGRSETEIDDAEKAVTRPILQAHLRATVPPFWARDVALVMLSGVSQGKGKVIQHGPDGGRPHYMLAAQRDAVDRHTDDKAAGSQERTTGMAGLAVRCGKEEEDLFVAVAAEPVHPVTKPTRSGTS